MNKHLLSNSGAANHIGIAANTLNYWRTTGAQKIPFIKVGGRVMYRVQDLDNWLSERTYQHTGQYSPK